MPGSHPIAPESVTMGQLYILLLDQKHDISVQGKRIEDLTGELALSRREAEEDRAERIKEVAMVRQETAEILQVFQSSKGVVTVIKFLGVIATAGLAIWGVWSLVRGLPVAAAEIAQAFRRD